MHDLTPGVDTDAEMRALLSWSRYTLQPPGDTNERKNIYESLHAGTPVLFPAAVPPPLRLPGWGALAVEPWAAANGHVDSLAGDGTLHAALDGYDAHMARFEHDRRPIVWGTAQFRAQLRTVVTSVFEL